MNSETKPIKMGQKAWITLSYFGDFTVTGVGYLAGTTEDPARFYKFVIDEIHIDSPDTFNACDLLQPITVNRHPSEVTWIPREVTNV